MSLRPSRASRIPSPPGPLCALLALLLLTPPGPLASAGPASVRRSELRCVCVAIASRIHPRMVSYLERVAAGPHCPNLEVIATLKSGVKACLDPEAPVVKKLLQNRLDSRRQRS